MTSCSTDAGGGNSAGGLHLPHGPRRLAEALGEVAQTVGVGAMESHEAATVRVAGAGHRGLPAERSANRGGLNLHMAAPDRPAVLGAGASVRAVAVGLAMGIPSPPGATVPDSTNLYPLRVCHSSNLLWRAAKRSRLVARSANSSFQT